MSVIYENLKDLHVVATIIYAGDDGVAYIDEDCTESFTVEDLQEAFIKGSVIISGDSTYKPTAITVSDDTITMTYDAGTLTTATEEETTEEETTEETVE